MTSNGRDTQSIQQLWGLNEETGMDDDEDDDNDDDDDDDDDNLTANSKFRAERAEKDKNQRIKGMRAGTGKFLNIIHSVFYFFHLITAFYYKSSLSFFCLFSKKNMFCSYNFAF